MTTKYEILRWLRKAPKTATHMLVCCDTFDHEDYPVYTSNPKAEIAKRHGVNMQRVHEVYDLNKPIEDQIDRKRAWSL